MAFSVIYRDRSRSINVSPVIWTREVNGWEIYNLYTNIMYMTVYMHVYIYTYPCMCLLFEHGRAGVLVDTTHACLRYEYLAKSEELPRFVEVRHNVTLNINKMLPTFVCCCQSSGKSSSTIYLIVLAIREIAFIFQLFFWRASAATNWSWFLANCKIGFLKGYESSDAGIRHGVMMLGSVLGIFMFCFSA